jgi:biotin transport system substrate-specific component
METTSQKKKLITPKKGKLTTTELVYMAFFVALMTICAWINIPTAVPFTLQTFAVFLAIGLLGTKRGTLSILVYVILGAIGVPVFAGMKGGFAALFGLTGGYIIGFVLSALVTGFLISKLGNKIPVMALAMFIGLLVCYAFGTAWFMVLYTNTKGSISLIATLTMCVFPYIIPDCIKIALAIFLTKKLNRFVKLPE